MFKHTTKQIKIVMQWLSARRVQIIGKKELNEWKHWVDKFLSLRDYRATYSDIGIISSTAVGRFNNLHRWIIEQRINHRDRGTNYHQAKVELLDTLEFNWQIASSGMMGC